MKEKTRIPNACDSCHYYRRATENADFGNCCINPPQVIVKSDGADKADRASSIWPTVNASDWCGQYKAAVAEAVNSNIADATS